MLWVEHIALFICTAGWIGAWMSLTDIRWRRDKLADMYMDALQELNVLKASSEER